MASEEGQSSAMFLSPKSRVLGDDAPQREYCPSLSSTADAIIRKGLHFGQRKLLLSEVEYLSEVVAYLTTVEKNSSTVQQQNKESQESNKNHFSPSQFCSAEDRPVLVVYAGAANGQHLPFLFKLFPNISFILIDPAPFCSAVQEISKKENSPVLALISDYCTAQLCAELYQKYKGSYHIVLVSDIRSGEPRKMKGNAEHTAMILRDNSLQQEWCNALHPEWALLKFHPPYPGEKNPSSPRYDPEDHTPDSIDYLGGVCLLGVWAPKSSSEVRLAVSGPFPQSSSLRCQYSCVKHEQQCFYYNCTKRYQSDCEAERIIWEKYISLARMQNPCSTSRTDTPFLWGELKSAILSFSNSIDKVSAAASHALGHDAFLPLSPEFTENHARFFFLVTSISGVTWNDSLCAFYERWKPYMTIDVVEMLIREHRCSENLPVGVKVLSQSSSAARSSVAEGKRSLTNEEGKKNQVQVLPLDFWKFFARGNFAEAYSISTLKWKFFHRLPPLRGHEKRPRSKTEHFSFARERTKDENEVKEST